MQFYRSLGTVITGIVGIIAVGCQAPTSSSIESQLDSHLGRYGKMKALASAYGQLSSSESAQIVDAKIIITEIHLRNVAGEFYRFPQESAELSLSSLSSGLSELLAHAQFPEGQYDLIRFITAESGVVKFADGSESSVRVPSGTQSGIKVFFDQPLEISQGQIQKVGLEFDLSRSWVAVPGGYLFKPVIRVSVSQYIDPNPDGSSEPAGSDPSSGGSTGGTTDTSGGSTGGSTDTSGGSTSGDVGSDGAVDYPIAPLDPLAVGV